MLATSISTADAALAMAALNREAKLLNAPNRTSVYALKYRLCRALYERGYCVGVETEVPADPDHDWRVLFTYVVDGVVYAFHVPKRFVTWRYEERETDVEAKLATHRRLTPRERGGLVALVARWLSEVERG